MFHNNDSCEYRDVIFPESDLHWDGFKVLSVHTQQLATGTLGQVRGRREGEPWTAVVGPRHLALSFSGHTPPGGEEW